MSFKVNVGRVTIGEGAPVSVQSMCDTKTSDVLSTVSEIHSLTAAGCDIIRVAVKDDVDAVAIADIVKEIEIPLVADVHFDYKLAIKAAKMGASKIRINPGNIGGEDNIKAVADELGARSIPIRIGVNGGSLEKEFEGLEHIDAMVESALKHISILKKFGFYNTIVSIKSSSISETVAANRKFASLADNPLHLGLTESGTLERGLIKSSAALGTLLLDGIGDTIRISLTDKPEKEVLAARYLLNSLKLRADMPEIVSCPTCGRTEIAVKELAESIQNATENLHKKIKIAVMGCVVNGVGEGKDADIGVAGGREKSVIFRKGIKIKTVNNCDILSELLNLITEEYGR